MKKFLLALFLLVPSVAQAQSFESSDACKQFKSEINRAVDASKPLAELLTDNTIDAEQYLAQLYQGVQILSKSGELFFKASDAYESTCQTELKQAGQIEAMRVVFDWYLAPVKLAYQFFNRAKSQAVRLGRQSDVDAFVKSIREYEDSVMKIAANCESVLAGTKAAAECRTFSSKLEDSLR